MESIVFKKTLPFLRPLLAKQQFGFLKNRSCLSQLLLSFAEILEAIENKNPCNVVYVDFMKAFDSVPHSELLFKLWRIGITGPLWKWFKAYLSNRQHFVHIEGSGSEQLPVHSGVPQGSLLGPLLFIIYINDIPSTILHSSVYMFADDTKFIKPISSTTDHLHMQEDMSALNDWCKVWKLNLHLHKCFLLKFHLSQQTSHDHELPILEISGSSIPQSETHRDLGIIVQGNLSWDDHYSKICANAYASFHLIRRNISASANMLLKKRLYLTLVRSHLSYCSQIWRPRLIKDIEVLERVQRRASKFLTSDYTSNYKARLIKLQMLPLMYWFELQDIMFLVKTIKNPPDNFNLSDYITFNTSSTRAASSHHLNSKFCRLSITRHFYFNRIVRLWNSLPQLDLSLSVLSIKKKLHNYFWNHFLTFFNPTNTCSFHILCPCSNCYISKPCPTTYHNSYTNKNGVVCQHPTMQ